MGQGDSRSDWRSGGGCCGGCRRGNPAGRTQEPAPCQDRASAGLLGNVSDCARCAHPGARQYLFNSRGCAQCHGINGAGREFINDGKGLRLKSPNISLGQGSVVARYTPEDWERTIRHGVKPDGRAMFLMPSEDYNGFTEPDLAALVAYVRSLPPASGSGAVVELSLPVKVMYG